MYIIYILHIYRMERKRVRALGGYLVRVVSQQQPPHHTTTTTAAAVVAAARESRVARVSVRVLVYSQTVHRVAASCNRASGPFGHTTTKYTYIKSAA